MGFPSFFNRKLFEGEKTSWIEKGERSVAILGCSQKVTHHKRTRKGQKINKPSFFSAFEIETGHMFQQTSIL